MGSSQVRRPAGNGFASQADGEAGEAGEAGAGSKRYAGVSIAVLLLVVSLIVPSVFVYQYPGYSVVDDSIGTLRTSASPVRVWATVVCAFEGLLVLAYAAWARAEMRFGTRAKQWFVSGVSAFAVCTVVAVVSPDISPHAAGTAPGGIEGIASWLGLLLILVAIAATWRISELRPVRDQVAVLLAIALVTRGLVVASTTVDDWLFAATGFYQRMSLGAIYLALAIAALPPENPQRQPPSPR